MEPAGVGPGNIRSLILEKEKELHDINEYRIRTLEALLRDKETAFSGAKQKLSKLQEDFKYNLKLLEGRDEELALYDANFASLKNVLRDRETELSEIRAREAELQAEAQRNKKKTQELELQYQQKLKDVRAQMEGARWKFENELRRQQDAMETQRRSLERQLREKEEGIETQRREVSVTFDEVMRQRETEFKKKSDELLTKVRELELKNKAVTREADAQRSRAEELKTKNENLQQLMQENDKEMKSLEWTLADVKAVKGEKVKELETEVEKLNDVKQKLLDEYESKMAELLQSLHSVEKAFVQQKTHYDEELQRLVKRKENEAEETSSRSEAKLEAVIVNLRGSEERVEALQSELKQTKWDVEDKLMAKEREVERAKSALQDLEDDQHRAATEMQLQLRSGDREVQTLQERLQDAGRQISLLKEKDKAYRQELLESVEKQEDLQRELVAVNLRWENRWQDQQQELDERHELRLRELQQMKDRLLGEKQATEERLLHTENELQRLRSELSTLKSSTRITECFGSHYLTPTARHNGDARGSSDSAHAEPSPLWSGDHGTLSPLGVSPLLTGSPVLRRKSATSNSASALEMENAKLRELIQQMKESLIQQAEEMEASAGHASGSRSASKLAAQLLEAQERCIALETQLREISSSSIALQLESCKRELVEAQESIEVKTKRIAELEAHVEELEGMQAAEPKVQSGRVTLESQLTDIKRKLEAANNDIDRLVRERSQLMELSNQLRADLRRSGSDSWSRSATPRVEFTGKKDYENLIAELTRSLEEARVYNKTLKKELRRMVKVHVQLQQDREAQGLVGSGEGETSAAAASRDQVGRASSRVDSTEGEVARNGSEKRHSSTLSMMKSLDPGSARGATRHSAATASTHSSESRDGPSATSNIDLDEQLLALARNKRPSAKQSTTPRRTSRTVPPTILERTTDSDAEAEVSATDEDRDEVQVDPGNGAPDKSPLARIFPSAAVSTDVSNASAGGSSSAKVTDARLKLQQAKEMLMLSGKRAPISGPRASLATFASTTAGATRLSDRETSSQRSAVKKLKQLQSKRAEMVSERKNVRNYSLGS